MSPTVTVEVCQTCRCFGQCLFQGMKGECRDPYHLKYSAMRVGCAT